MNAVIITKAYEEPPFCEKEILRYAGCKSSDDELLQLLRACIEEVRGKLNYRVCYRELPLTIIDNVHQQETEQVTQEKLSSENTATSLTAPICDFGYIKVHSADLAKNLQGCNSVILFAATLGVEIDRLIAKYGRISPTKALMFQAIGTERIESLCDVFCADIQADIGADTGLMTDGNESVHACGIRPRFSPGYGDLPLEVQRDIFQLLECSKQIGMALNDSLLMSPSKSVTAFVGLIDSPESIRMEIAETAKSVNTEDITVKKINENKCARCKKTDCTYRGVL